MSDGLGVWIVMHDDSAGNAYVGQSLVIAADVGAAAEMVRSNLSRLGRNPRKCIISPVMLDKEQIVPLSDDGEEIAAVAKKTNLRIVYADTGRGDEAR